jgi:pyrroloquinoline quinone biosynthesis protein B
MRRGIRGLSVAGSAAIAVVGACLLVAAACGPGPGSAIGERSLEKRSDLPEGPIALVLGSAQDGGLPHAGCYCPNCESARSDPSRRRFVASLGVVFPREGQRFLIDATPDVRPQLDLLQAASPVVPLREGRRPVEGILLTHAHIGHYLGLAFFGYESIHTTRVPTLCTPKMARFLASNAPWDQLVRLENIVPVEVQPRQTVSLHERLEVNPVSVPHRDEYADTVGWILRGPERSLLYVPDTDSWEAWDPPLTERLKGIDIAILDGTFYSPDELPGRDISTIAHPLMVRTMDLLEPLVRSGRLEVHFTHLNHSNLALDPEGEAARTIRQRGFHIAREGQEIPL